MPPTSHEDERSFGRGMADGFAPPFSEADVVLDVVLPPDWAVRPGAASSTASLGSSALIEVHGEIIVDGHGQQRAALTVRDHGRWCTPPDDEPARGDGIRLMRACTDEVTVLRGANGSVVHLRSRPLPTLPLEPG